MIRPRVIHSHVRSSALVLVLNLIVPCTNAQSGKAATDTDFAPGQFFPITEPITHDTLTHIRAATRQLVDRNAAADQAKKPILVFVFLPGETAPGTSEFGASYDLARHISQELGGAKMTVGYVPQPLRGYAVLPAIACDEIVMGPTASLGPITPEGHAVDAALRGPVQFLAMRKTRDPDLLLGMLDRDADLRLVRNRRQERSLRACRQLEGLSPKTRRHRQSAGLGRGPARCVGRGPGTRGGILQANR